MLEKDIEQEMFKLACEFIATRYPVGWGGAAVMRTAGGGHVVSVAIETLASHVDLCIEVGAMCEASKLNLKITHTICVVRDDEKSAFKVLTPCGVCQERLRFWGADLKAAVTTPDNSLKFVTLDELQPYHWTNAFSDIVGYEGNKL